jgi:hypothetical protein
MRLPILVAIGLVVCGLCLPGCSSRPGGISCPQYKNDLVLALANPHDQAMPRSLADIAEPYRGQITYQRQHFYENWYGPSNTVRGVLLPQTPANPYQQAQIIGQWYAFSTSVQSRAMTANGCS